MILKIIKKITIIVILIALFACKKENNPLNKIKEAKQNIGNVNNIVKAAQDLEKNTSKLAELTPVTKEKIKSWMPKELGDLKRTEYNIGNQMGASTVRLTYKDEDNKKIKITVKDGAGAGASIVSMFSMMTNVDVDSENETGYERTANFDGQKVLIKYQSSGSYENADLTCLINNRFSVEADGWNMDPKELWNYIKKLKINKLEK